MKYKNRIEIEIEENKRNRKVYGDSIEGRKCIKVLGECLL